jgi:protein O-mannosyl-transferase
LEIPGLRRPRAGAERPPEATARLRSLGLALGLAVLTVLVFAPVVGNDFVTLDDPAYVTGNRQVRRGLTAEGFVWAWGAEVAANWHPLTLLSHMLDCELYGLDPGGHHLTSLLLHAANAVLLFAVWRRLTGAAARSAVVAALFAVHPLHVESVAWVAERKDVLSGFFFLLTLAAWAGWVRRPTRSRYLLALLAFVLGLLAKPMLVTLPLVLLLLDVWPLERLPRGAPAAEVRRALGRLVREKLPFFVAALAASVVTLFTQREAMFPLAALPPTQRVANALLAYAAYLGDTVWPQGLTVFYPLPPAQPVWRVALAAALFATLTGAALARLRRAPWLAVGWLWFAGMLLPVIGLLQVGSQGRADRYTYLPSIGLFAALVWEVCELALRRKRPARGPGATRAALAGAALLAIASLAVAARAQVATWRDSLTLFQHALAVTERNLLAEMRVGTELGRRGDHAGAERHLRAAVRIAPGAPRPQAALGRWLHERGRPGEALPHLRQASRLRPRDARLHLRLGIVLAELGRTAEARAHFRRALELNPGLEGARRRLAALDR